MTSGPSSEKETGGSTDGLRRLDSRLAPVSVRPTGATGRPVGDNSMLWREIPSPPSCSGGSGAPSAKEVLGVGADHLSGH